MSLDNGNNKITIIISAYNRPNYLKRILNYYNKYGSNFKIIVADSSSNENKRLNKDIISLLSDTDILYLKYPVDIKPFYYAKNADALNHVTTKYCVNCADDDFITPNSINKSIEFLENNLDYTCVHGDFISFFIKYDKRGNGNFFWIPIYQFSNSVIFANPKDRLLYQFSSYMQTIYSVHRTNFLKMIFRETIKYTEDDRFGELLPSMLDLVYGKIKKIDIFYSAREMIINSAGRKSKNFEDFIKDGTYEKKYIKFKVCLAKHLTNNSQLSIDESKKVIDKAMSIYLEKCESRNLKSILLNKINGFLDCLIISEAIKNKIRWLYYKKLFKLNQKQIFHYKNKKNTSFSEYVKGVNKIRNYLLNIDKNLS